MPENYGQMTQSTYLQIDACPARIDTEEATRAAADAKQVAAIEEIINSRGKNLCAVASGASSGGSQWVDIPLVIPAGEYVLSFTSLTSTDTDVTTCKANIYNASNQALASVSLARGSNVSQSFTTTGTSSYIRLYCADSVSHSTGDVVTFSGCMVCTKTDWDISHSYVAYKQGGDWNILQPTGDTTDRASEILAILNKYGECKLIAGEYYCSGFEMPAGTTLKGAGKQTVMRLPDSIGSGYCVRIHRYATVEGIHFLGGVDAPTGIFTDGTAVGTRHGIYLGANADGAGTSHTDAIINRVSNCWFEYFSGAGFYAENTGTGKFAGVILDGCTFRQCMCGIDIAYYSEYSKFTDCVMEQCNIGCINNGGNNVFANCTFHGVRGFVIDNSNSGMTNNSHGTCTGCTFNHIDNMNNPPGGGKAVDIKSAANGYIFDGCQFWYGAISVASSKGIHFSDCLFGGGTPSISVTGDYGAWFDGCTFQNTPSISANALTRFDNCYDSVSGYLVSPNPALVDVIDGKPKNKMPQADATGGAGQSVDIECDIPAGDYVLSFTSLSSTHATPTTCRVAFIQANGTSYAAAYIQMQQGTNVSKPFKMTATAKKFRIIPADTVGNTAASDVVSFTGCMVCTQAAFQISQSYVAPIPTNA